jgi:uncharacterized protein (TIGR02246 family)
MTGLSWAAHHEAGRFERLAQEYEAAWATGDAEALGPLYTERALGVDAFGQVQRGREAIVAALAEGLNGPFAGTSIAITVGKSQDLGGGTRTFEAPTVSRARRARTAGRHRTLRAPTSTPCRRSATTGG